MAESKITLRPGVNSLATRTLNSAGWSAGNLIRFMDGDFIQNVGGWQAFNATPLVGVCRSMHAWADLQNNTYLACGTNERLQLYWAGSQYDITPITATNAVSSGFSTTSGSSVVNIKDVGNSAREGDWVYIEIPVAVGGLVMFMYYQIVTVVDADNYEVDGGGLATSTVTDGGHTPQFDTVNTSDTVTVTLPNHGYAPGDIFIVQESTSVGGLTLDGPYQVITVPTADTFTITASSTASGDDTAYENGDATNVSYLLPSGPASNEPLTGYGAGGYGTGGYGSGAPTDTINPARIWSLDNFGELLLANPTNGALYVWAPPVADGNVATEVGTAPDNNIGMFVGMPQAQCIIYGAETGGIQDPLLIKWSDTGDYTDWTPSALNQAGSYRLSRGSHIVGGLQAAQTALIWTDLDLWSMVYQGPPYIYSINTIAQNCGLIAQLAASVLGKNVYWMSLKGFFTLQGGAVSPVACTVWDEIFADLDTTNQNKIIAASNTPFNEVWFFYPSLSGGTGEIDAYVKLTVADTGYLWDFGRLERTAWIDQSIFGMPLGVDAAGLVQQHEIGYTDNGDPIDGIYALSGYADIDQGLEFPFVDQIIPDFRFYDAGATAQFSVYGKTYPFSDPTVHGPFDVTTSTKFITMRSRQRQAAFRIDWDGESFVRLGAVRFRIAPAGRR